MQICACKFHGDRNSRLWVAGRNLHNEQVLFRLCRKAHARRLSARPGKAFSSEACLGLDPGVVTGSR